MILVLCSAFVEVVWFSLIVQKCHVTVTDDSRRRAGPSTREHGGSRARCRCCHMFLLTFAAQLNLTLHTPQFISVASAPYCEMLFDSLCDVGVWVLWLRERAVRCSTSTFPSSVKSERHDRRESSSSSHLSGPVSIAFRGICDGKSSCTI